MYNKCKILETILKFLRRRVILCSVTKQLQITYIIQTYYNIPNRWVINRVISFVHSNYFL